MEAKIIMLGVRVCYEDICNNRVYTSDGKVYDLMEYGIMKRQQREDQLYESFKAKVNNEVLAELCSRKIDRMV